MPVARIGWTALLALSLMSSAAAHRLDEYLQATLIEVTRNGIDLEIHLTPGVAMLPAWMSVIDQNRDGQISSEEQQTYVSRVARDVQLRVDGEPASLSLIASAFPTLEAMRDGVGTITVKLRTTRIGHRLRFENRHLPQVSAYLVNCLAAPADGLTVTHQERDHAQRSIEFEYSFTGGAVQGPAKYWPLALLLPLLARLAVLLYKAKNNSRPRSADTPPPSLETAGEGSLEGCRR